MHNLQNLDYYKEHKLFSCSCIFPVKFLCDSYEILAFQTNLYILILHYACDLTWIENTDSTYYLVF